MPRDRILVVGPPKSGKLTLLKSLTGTLTDIPEVHAGFTQPHTISNKYYSATVDIWVDEFSGEDQDTCEQWVDTFCSEEAREVRDVLGAVICTQQSAQNLTKLKRFIDTLEEEMWDGVSILATKNDETVEDAFDYGFEHVNISDADRIREALEVFPWGSADNDAESEQGRVDDDDDDDNTVTEKVPEDLDDIDFTNMSEKDKEDVAQVLAKLSTPLTQEGGSERDVDKLDEFMQKLTVARENKSMTDTERKQLSQDLATELLQLL